MLIHQGTLPALAESVFSSRTAHRREEEEEEEEVLLTVQNGGHKGGKHNALPGNTTWANSATGTSASGHVRKESEESCCYRRSISFHKRLPMSLGRRGGPRPGPTVIHIVS